MANISDPSTSRLGAIYPDDAWVDRDAQAFVDEFSAFLPPSVEVIAAATPIPPVKANSESAVRLAENGDIEESARRSMRYEPTCFAYYCTTISFVRGVGGDVDISRRIREATGVDVVTTTSTAMILALKALDISRVALASPYMPDVEEKFIGFMEAHGIQVANSRALALLDGHSLVDPEMMREFAESADVPAAEAIFVGCTGQRLSPYLDAMEEALGKPVLTANQVTSWHALQLMGLPPQLPGRGRLFAGDVVAALS